MLGATIGDTACTAVAATVILIPVWDQCKGSRSNGVWVEIASPGGTQGAMTDGLVEVNGVSCKLLLSDDVYMGRVSSNGSIPGLVGKISADPNTLRNVTSESADDSCVIAWVSSWVSEI